MAENYLFSKTVGVFVDMSDSESPNWELVTCTTSKSLEISVDGVDLNNDCTGDFSGALPSTVSWSMSIEGDADIDPSNGAISAAALFGIATNREIRNWKLESQDGNYIRYGRGFLSSYSESLTTPEYLSFSATLNGVGELFDAIPS